MAEINRRQTVSVIILCLLWYIISSSNNVIGKMVLNAFPYPMTITMVQLLSISIYSGPFFNLFNIRKYIPIPWNYYIRLIIPLALGKFLASVTSHISIWKVPVSYAHTGLFVDFWRLFWRFFLIFIFIVKATMPLFTVILSRILMKEKQTKIVYFSLVPIILGVTIATLTEISFDIIGFGSAIIATMGFSLQNIFSKKVLKDTGIHHLRLLHLLGKLALFMFLPIWFFVDFFAILKHPVFVSESFFFLQILQNNLHFFFFVLKVNVDYRVIILLFTDGVLNWLQNIIAFSVLSIVTPLTYAVASASKRIFVIAVSLLILGNPVTKLNVFGMLLAILGVLCYNRAKYISKSSNKQLPFTHGSWNKYTTLPNSLPETLNQNGYKNALLNNNSTNSSVNKMLFV